MRSITQKTFWSDTDSGIYLDFLGKQFRGPILNIADKSIVQCFSPLHSPEVCFNEEIDWDADFAGNSWPKWPASKLNEAIFENDFINNFYKADIKLNWEFNKHEWFVALACAWLLTGKSSYINVLKAHMRNFMARTIPDTGAPWCATLIVAQRLLNWTLAAGLLKGYWQLEDYTFLLDSVQIHVDHILSHIENAGRPSNHIISNWSAVALAGLNFPELNGGKDLALESLAILREQMDNQVYRDGIQWEQSLPYHRYVLEFFLLPALAAKGNGVCIPDGYMDTIERMMDVLLQTMNLQTGLIPVIGDGDGAKVWRFSTAHTLDVRALLALGAVLFDRADFKWASRGHLEDVIWLIGMDGIDKYNSLPCHPPKERDKSFPDGGYYLLRTDWNERRTEILFDCGRISMGDVAKDYSLGGHGHADTLHFNLTMNGYPICGDPGCYAYTGKSREWHDYFRGGGGHNSILIDGVEMSTLTTTWAMENRPFPGPVTFISRPHGSLVEGIQDGFMRLPDPVSWKRSIILLENGLVIIRDSIGAREKHTLEFRFHLAPDITAEWREGGLVLGKKSQDICWFFYQLPFQHTVELVRGQREPLLGYWSSDYNLVQDTTVIRAHMNISDDFNCFWAFCPPNLRSKIAEVKHFFENLYHHFVFESEALK